MLVLLLTTFKKQTFEKKMSESAANPKSKTAIELLVMKVFLKKNEELEEKIQPFMISYSKIKHAGFEDAKSLQDLQTKAQKIKSKRFYN